MRIKSFSNSVQSKKFLCLPLYSKLHGTMNLSTNPWLPGTSTQQYFLDEE